MIKSFLTNRLEYVHFKNSESDSLENGTEIPQGSILDPLYFSIIINDLDKSSNKFKFSMYADVTPIDFNLEDFSREGREVSINAKLEKVNTWLIE